MTWIVYHFNPYVTQLEASKIIWFDSNRLLTWNLSKLCSIIRIKWDRIDAIVDWYYTEEAVRNYAKREGCVYLKSKFKT